MRYILFVALIIPVLAACKKDKFTTAPQISYKSLNPNTVYANLTSQPAPVITLHVTDAEGDLSFVPGSDSAWIYVRNLLTNTRDSLQFPDLTGVTTSKFKFDLDIPLTSNNLIKGGPRPRPKTDTLYFEVYITDIAKNKSNVIVTQDPVYFIFP
jgi:hypothetical protein